MLFSKVRRGIWFRLRFRLVRAKASSKPPTWKFYVDPRAEWRQMFNEIWRGERDFFYDPNTHGLDIEKAKKLYAPYLEAVAHRDDLNYLFREMLNQITVGHMYISGGDAASQRRFGRSARRGLQN
jgi:hypothetical protein